MSFDHLRRSQIDTQKWNWCIEHAQYSRPEALSWYLDIVTQGQWDALVWGDYEMVFPVPWTRRPIFYKKVYQPFFAQQLGLFAASDVAFGELLEAVVFLGEHFRKVVIHLHEKTPHIEKLSEYSIMTRSNFEIDLSLKFEQVRSKYNRNLRRNLATAAAHRLVLAGAHSTAQLVRFYSDNKGREIPDLKNRHYRIVGKLMQEAVNRGMGKIMTVGDDGGRVHASAFFLLYHDRVVNLFGCSWVGAKQNGAMHFLLDRALAEFCSTERIFDFEGSSIPSIATFFRSFGAEERYYFQFRK